MRLHSNHGPAKPIRLLTSVERLNLFAAAGIHGADIGNTVTAVLTPAQPVALGVGSLAAQYPTYWASSSYTASGDQGQLTINAEKHGILFVNFPTTKGKAVEVVINLNLVGGTKLDMMAGYQELPIQPAHGGDLQLSCLITPTDDFGDSVAIRTVDGMDWAVVSAQITFLK